MKTEEKTLSRREILFNAGVQYGHMKSVWCPLMKPFIWGEKNGLHLINIALTELQLGKAEQLLSAIAEKGLPILFVGTKRVARNVILKRAGECGCSFFADRWIGGTLTNYQEVRKSVKNLLHNTDIYEKSDRSIFTKKELSIIKKKIERAKKTIGGIQNLTYPIGALVVADAIKDRVAINEAITLGIPVVAITDTNSNPSGITVPIPSNDDLEKSLDTVFGFLAQAVLRGKEKFLLNNPIVAAIKEVEGAPKKGKNTFFQQKGEGKKQEKNDHTGEVVTATPVGDESSEKAVHVGTSNHEENEKNEKNEENKKKALTKEEQKKSPMKHHGKEEKRGGGKERKVREEEPVVALENKGKKLKPGAKITTEKKMSNIKKKSTAAIESYK